MPKTPSSTFNSKIRGNKKIDLSSENYNLISTALSFIWIKTEKKVESCNFEQDRVRLSYSKNLGRAYFDLEESNKVYFSLFFEENFASLVILSIFGFE